MTEAKSAFYLAAAEKGKGVAYMCARGTARSPIAASFARSRGEENSIVAPRGYDALHYQATTSEQALEACDIELITLLGTHVLRVFSDETSSFRWLEKRLLSLQETGLIGEGDYEIISMETLMAEQRQAGRLREFMEVFSRAMFCD